MAKDFRVKATDKMTGKVSYSSTRTKAGAQADIDSMTANPGTSARIDFEIVKNTDELKGGTKFNGDEIT